MITAQLKEFYRDYFENEDFKYLLEKFRYLKQSEDAKDPVVVWLKMLNKYMVNE